VRRVLACGVAAIVLGAHVAAAQTPFQELEQARAEFRASNFTAAIPLLKDLVYPQPRLARPDDLLEVHLMLGACQYETGGLDGAHDEFVKALAIQPDVTLDTLFYSTGAVRLFDETKAEYTARAKAEQAQREAEQKLEETRQRLANLVVYEVHPYALNFAPFGLGQFGNHERRRGILFAAAEGTTFAASVGIWAYLVKVYGYNGRVPLADAANVRREQQIEVGTGAVFIGVYVLGVIDAIYHYKYGTQVTDPDLLLSPPAQLPPPKQTSLRDRLHFGPVLLPSGVGVGLALEDF
jgi:tetratricopeptide (TPR) repeat protein